MPWCWLYITIKEEETGLWTTWLCWPCRGSAGPALSCCVGVCPPSHSPWRAPLSLASATAHPFLASTSAHQFLIPSSGAFFKEVPDEAPAGSLRLLLVLNVVPLAPFRGFWRLLLICSFSLCPVLPRPRWSRPPSRSCGTSPATERGFDFTPMSSSSWSVLYFFPPARPNERLFCSSTRRLLCLRLGPTRTATLTNLLLPSKFYSNNSPDGSAGLQLQRRVQRTSDIKASDPNPHLWGGYKGININDFLSLLFVQPAKFMKSLLYTLAAQPPKLPPLTWTEHLKA